MGRRSSVILPPGDRTGHDERAGLDPVGDDPVFGAAQPLLALDLDGVGVRPLDLGAHLLEARDEVVDLGLLGRRPQDRVAVGEGGREHRVLGAHDRHEREADLRAAQPSRRRREVVAVAVLDLGAERPHRLDVEVDRSPPDPVAARVADDDPAATCQERAEQHERGAHLGRGLERARTAIRRRRPRPRRRSARDRSTTTPSSVRVWAMTRTSSISGHVREPAALAGQRRGREHLQGGVLRPADRDASRTAA